MLQDSHGTMGLTPKGIMPNPMMVPIDDKVSGLVDNVFKRE